MRTAASEGLRERHSLPQSAVVLEPAGSFNVQNKQMTAKASAASARFEMTATVICS